TSNSVAGSQPHGGWVGASKAARPPATWRRPRKTSLPPTRSAPPTVSRPAPVRFCLTARSLPTHTAPATSRSSPLRSDPPMCAPVPAVHCFHDTHDPETWLSLATEDRPLTPTEPSPDAPAPTLRKPTWVRFSQV